MTVFNVSNSTQLQSAVNSAVGGDTILLAAGNYGSGSISSKNYSSTVTIKSASTLSAAHFDSLIVSGSSNLQLEGLDVGHALLPTEVETSQMLRVQGSTGIKMVGLSVHGSLDNNPANDGMGVLVTGSSNVDLLGSTFRDLSRGAFFEKDSYVTISGNDFQMLRTDGIDFGAITGVVVDKNYFSNFFPALGDHPDAIQFWQVNQTTGSSNIAITNNTVMQGSGVGTQGFWISDPNAVGYSNILIQNNLLYGNDQYHGISVSGAHGVQILNNTVLSTSADAKTYWIQLYSGTDFVVKDNVTDMVLVQPGAVGPTLSHNLDLSVTPSAKSLIPNLNAPLAPKDLIIADYGYHLPATTNTSTDDRVWAQGTDPKPTTGTLPPAPVVETNTSSSLPKPASSTLPPTPAVETETASKLPKLNDILTSPPAHDVWEGRTGGLQFHAQSHALSLGHAFNHFVALP